jgi:hypothetical protein
MVFNHWPDTLFNLGFFVRSIPTPELFTELSLGTIVSARELLCEQPSVPGESHQLDGGAAEAG